MIPEADLLNSAAVDGSAAIAFSIRPHTNMFNIKSHESIAILGRITNAISKHKNWLHQFWIMISVQRKTKNLYEPLQKHTNCMAMGHKTHIRKIKRIRFIWWMNLARQSWDSPLFVLIRMNGVTWSDGKEKIRRKTTIFNCKPQVKQNLIDNGMRWRQVPLIGWMLLDELIQHRTSKVDATNELRTQPTITIATRQS